MTTGNLISPYGMQRIKRIQESDPLRKIGDAAEERRIGEGAASIGRNLLPNCEMYLCAADTMVQSIIKRYYIRRAE